MGNMDKLEDRFKGLPSKVEYLKIEDIKIPEFRLNSSFSEEGLEEFHASIGLDGVMQPVHVIRDKDGNVWLADGRHRLESARENGHNVIPAIVVDGTYEQAVLESALLNIHRGKVNPADLAQYVKGLREQFGWSLDKIADKLRISKGYISKLLKITEYDEVLEKLRNGELSVIEAYEMVKGFMMKPISSKKASFGETSSNKAFQGLSDRDLGVTESWKEASETGKRVVPLGSEEDEEITLRKCPICRESFQSKKEIAYILVHKHEKNMALQALKRLSSDFGNSYLNLEGEGGEKSDE